MPRERGGAVQPLRVVALTIAAAATDALSYLGLGHVFPANMTGNTVLLGLGVATGDYAGAYRSATALAVYVAAAFCFGAATAADSAVWRVRAALAVEWCLLFAAALWWQNLGSPPRAGLDYGLIMLAGAAMGVQSSVARKLKLPGITTTYLTGTWTSLANALGRRVRLRRRDPDEPAERYAQLAVVATYLTAALLASAAYVAWHAHAAFIPVAALAVAVAIPIQHEPGQAGYQRASGSRSGDGAGEKRQMGQGGDPMSQWSDDIQKAEQFAKDHPQQADEAIQKGEQYADQATGNRFDQQIGEAGQQAEQRFGGGRQGQGQGQGQQGQDPNMSQQQDEGQQDWQQQGQDSMSQDQMSQDSMSQDQGQQDWQQ